MKRVLALCAVVLGAISSATAANSLSELPRADFWVPDGPVNAVLETNGVIYLGGRFDYLRPNRGTGIALDLATQEPNLQFPQVNGVVLTAVSDGSGGFFLGGEFTEVGGLSRANLAYIRPDQTVDPHWNPGTDGRVEAMALTGRTLYVAGQFADVGGLPCDGLAALDAFVGKPTGWAPVVEPRGTVSKLTTYRGHAVAAGAFGAIGGQARNGLAMIDRDTAEPTAWDPNPKGGEVRALAIHGDTVYVGGTFTSIGGKSRVHLAAVDAITAQGTDWNPGQSSESDSVDALAVSGNRVFVGGRFTYLAGAPIWSLGALDAATGTVIANWNPNPIGIGQPEIHHLAVAQNRVYASGTFTNIGGLPRNGFAALDQSTGVAVPWMLEFSGSVSAIATSGYTAYAGGAVPNNAGVPRRNLAALDANTGMPTAWNPQVNGEVHALAASGSWIVAGGEFSNVGGLSRSNLAAIYPITGAPVSGWSPSINGAVRTLAMSANNDVFAGGDFTIVDGQTRNHLVSFDNGSLSSWNPNANGPVRSLVLGTGSVFAAGDFSTISGTARSYLAEISFAGAATSWNPKANGPVESLAISSSGLFAGGQFTEIGGAFRNRLALLDPFSGTAQSWNPNVNNTVRAISVRSNAICVGGDFTSVGGQSRSRLAEIDLSTGSPTAWNLSADATVNALASTPAELLAGGDFTNINSSTHPHFAAFGPDGLPVIVVQPTSRMLWPGQGLTLHVETIGDAPLAYQWQFNGNDISGEDSSSLTLPNVQLGDSGPYAVLVSNYLGRVRSDDAVLTVLRTPVIDAQPVSQTNSPGKEIQLSVGATGSPALHYSWRLNGAVIPGAIGPTLRLPRAQATNSGSYSVVAANAAGVVRSAVAKVVVRTTEFPPEFPFADDLENSTSTSLTSGQFSGNNESATLEPGEPQHGGVPGGKSVWMVWQPKGVGVAEFNTLGSGFDTVLAVYKNGQKGLEPVVSDDDRGGFHTSRVLFNVEDGVTYFIAIDGFDGASGNILLRWNLLSDLQPIPMIVEEPRCQIASEGSSVQFSVQVISPSDLTYQWYFGANRLPGETEPALTLRDVSLKDVGSYRVRIGNGSSIFTESLPGVLQLAGPVVFDCDQRFMTKMAYISAPPSFGVAPGSDESVSFSNAGGEGTPTDPTPCDTVLGSEMVRRFHVTEPGYMIVDTEGSETLHTVLLVIEGAPPSHTVIGCEVDGSVEFCAEVGADYYILVGGLNGARGRIQLNMRFCGAPEVNSYPSATFSPVARRGAQTILSIQTTNGACGLNYQWYRNGMEVPGAVYPKLTNDSGTLLGNTYSVVVTNCGGSASNVVATFLRLWIERSGMPPETTEYRLRAQPTISSTSVVHQTEEFSRWTPIYTNLPGVTLNLLLDPTRTVPSNEFFRIWPQR